jgi:DNA-directed RNA polymerase specialized sigma subunit
MSGSRPGNSPIPPKMSRRQAGKYLIEAALSALDMCTAELARLTGHAPVTLSRYKVGKRVPTKVFLLDLLDKAPNVGFTFDQIAPRLGYRWIGSKDPRRFQSFADYFGSIRVVERRNRDQFAIKLGISPQDVKDIEHGVLPEMSVIRKIVKLFLRPDYSVDDVIDAFAQLRPDTQMAELREQFVKFQHLPTGDSVRKDMENAIIEDCVPMAQRIAYSVAWRLNRPELAEEIWGEGLVLAVRDHDPRRGYLPGYLKARIKGLARGILWSGMQSGVSTVLRDYGLMVREAEEFLLQDLGRSPREAEIAQYLDIPPEIVREVSQALLASHTALSDNLEFLLQDAVEISSGSQLWADTDDLLVGRFRKLPEDEKELLYLHYFDQISIREIAEITRLLEGEVSTKIRWAVARLRSNLE